jgi:hypothetical protein
MNNQQQQESNYNKQQQWNNKSAISTNIGIHQTNFKLVHQTINSQYRKRDITSAHQTNIGQNQVQYKSKTSSYQDNSQREETHERKSKRIAVKKHFIINNLIEAEERMMSKSRRQAE